MKWNGLKQVSKGRALQTLGVSLAIGLGMTACSRDYTAAYLYVTSVTKGTDGVVNEYSIDSQTGALSALAESSVPTGRNPVSLVAAPNQKTIYVLNNGAPDSSIIQYAIGTDGKLYSENTYSVVQNASATVVGTFPTAAAIDPAGNFLYVTFQYQAGFSTLSPGPGGVAIYPIMHSSDTKVEGSLGAPLMNGNFPYFPVGNNPVGIVVTPHGLNTVGTYVYVIDQETTGGSAGVLLTFKQNSDGSLTAVPGPVFGGVGVGSVPAGIAEDPGGHFLYVTDEATNQLYGFSVQGNGTPLAMTSSPFSTGSFPEGVTVDPRGLYVYVANYGSSTISGYAIKQSTGSLSGVSGANSNQVATGPKCVTIDPALGIYLYTSNYLDNSVSAEKLSPNTGSLSQVIGSQFNSAAFPTCAVAVANGAHATQIVD